MKGNAQLGDAPGGEVPGGRGAREGRHPGRRREVAALNAAEALQSGRCAMKSRLCRPRTERPAANYFHSFDSWFPHREHGDDHNTYFMFICENGM